MGAVRRAHTPAQGSWDHSPARGSESPSPAALHGLSRLGPTDCRAAELGCAMNPWFRVAVLCPEKVGGALDLAETACCPDEFSTSDTRRGLSS